jgi:AcrR family transcriptional regulator
MRAVAKAALGRPSTFNRDDIVDGALALLARDGVEALSLRGLARELGCVLGTINYHFDNLADLEDALTARLLERLPVLDAARPEPLREQLVELGLAQIEAHSTHPYLRHAAGPVSIEIAAQQLRQHWITLQSAGLPEHLAMLCIEMLSGLAHNRGTEIYRLRNGGERALHLYQEFSSKLGKAPPGKLTAASFSAEIVDPLNREMLGNAIDIFLRGIEAGDRVRPRTAARSVK